MSIKTMLEAWKGKSVEDILREEYIDNDKPMKQIARELHLGLGTVYKWVTEYGLHKFNEPWTTGLYKEEIREIIKMKEGE